MTLPTEIGANSSMDDILIVDNESSNLKLLSEILVKAGYRVRPANRPQLAIDSATSQPPKLILLDVKMPEMDGVEICQQLKQDDRTRDIPIIFISALSEAKKRVKCFEAGGVDFISKPFDELEVLARVRTHVNLRNLQLNMEEQVLKHTEEFFKSEARFRATFDQAAVGIAHVAPDGRFLRLNDKYCDIVGYGMDEMQELTFQDITHPDDLEADVKQVNSLLNDEIKTHTMEKRYVRKDGELVWVDLTVSLKRDEAGQAEWFVAVVQDITDRKLAEKTLQESEEHLLRAQEMANVGSWQWDISENRIEWSPQVYKIYGIDPEISLTYENLLKSIHPEDREYHDKTTTAWLNNRGGPPYEYRVVRPNGDIRHIYGKGKVECDAVGEPVRFSGTLQDVTELKKAELAHLKSEARFSATFGQAAVGIAHVAHDGHFLRINDKFCDIVGYDKAEMLALTFHEITHPDDLNADLEQLNYLLNDEIKTYSMEKRYLRKNGDLIWVDLTVSLVRDEAGQPEWFVAVVKDITQQKEAEENLNLIKRTIDVSPDSAYWVDSSGRFVYVNDAACTRLGYRRDELLQMYIFDVDPFLSKRMWARFWDERRQLNLLTFEATHRRKDGSEFPVEVSSIFIEFNGKEFVNGFARDITARKQAELALLKKEQLTRSLLNATTDLTTILEEDGTILDLNDALVKILERTREELIGCNIFDILPLEMVKDRKPRVMRALAEGKSLRYVDRNRPEFVADTGIYPIMTPEGEKNQVVIFAHDITEREKTENELRKSEARFSSYFHLPFHGVAITSPRKGWIEVNDRICSMLGYDRDELLSMTWAELTHPEDISAGDEKFESALAGQIDSYSLEKRFVRKDGMVIWTHLDVACVRTPDGEVDYFLAVLADITDRKQSDHQLQESRDYLDHLISSIPDAIFSIKLPERTVEWARDTYGVLGHDLDKYIGNTTEWLYRSPEEHQAFGAFIQNAIRDGKDSLITQMEMLNKNGEAVPIEVNATIFYEKGEPVNMIGLIRDISERKKMENDLRQKEEGLRKAQEIAHLGSWSWDLATDQLSWSEEMYRIYGIDPETPLTFETLLDKIHPKDREHHKRLGAELIEGTTGPNFRYRIIRPSGTVRYIYGMTMVEKDESGVPVRLSGTLQDVTDIKTVEMAYRGSETRLKEVQKIARIGFWELDARTKKLSWSDEIFHMLELNQQEFEASFEKFLSIIHPEDQQMVKRQYTESFETRAPYSGTCRIVLPGGREKHLYRTAKPNVDSDGNLLKTIGIIQDITELKEAQSESTNLRLEMAHLNRVMTMNELAASLAHEINQPLGAIVNNASTAKILNSRSSAEDEDLNEILNDIADDALRAGQVIRKIRDVMQKGDAIYESLDINKLLDDVVVLYRNAFNLDHVSVVLNKSPDLIHVKGDQIRLQQVLMNLITNAMDAMANSPQKILELRSTFQTQGLITVSISDSGPGVEKSKIDQVFEPFFTTKQEGLGIGLRLCKSIIEEHGGHIWVEKNRDVGATFFFTLQVFQGGTES